MTGVPAFAVLRALVAAVLLAGLTGGCGSGQGSASVQPRDGRAGLHLTGTFDGRQVAVGDGLPQLVVGDCDPMDGVDEDVCFHSRTIDGSLFVLVFENPAVLEAGTSLPVAAPACRTPRACDAERDVAIVDVQLDTEARRRAVDGRLTVDVAELGLRYRGEVSLVLPGGRLSGTFDVVPRPD